MNERCQNCGAELFAGQQFCRACGASTQNASDADSPTQILPHGQAEMGQQSPPPAASATTSPLSADRETARGQIYLQNVDSARVTGRTSALGAPRDANVFPAPRTRSSRKWLYGLLALLLIVPATVFIAAALFLAQSSRTVRFYKHESGSTAANSTAAKTSKTVSGASVPALPSLPDMPASSDVADNSDDEDGAVPLDETGADVSGDQTVLIKTFPLSPGATFALTNLSGDITIEGWDAQQAEVTIVKRGGTAGERADVPVSVTQHGDRVALKTSDDADDAGIKDVQYRIKLPRSLRRIEIAAREANIKLTGVHADADISLVRGNIELTDVPGAVKTATAKGDTKITFANAPPVAAQTYTAMSGDIELRLGAQTNADLNAQTIRGDISADAALNFKSEKSMVGQQLSGRTGRGGHPIHLEVVNGNIKIKR